MTLQRSYRFGLAMNTAGEMAGRAAAVIAGVILAKVLGATLFGRYFSDQALVLVGAGFYNLGFGQGYRQTVARRPESRMTTLLPAVILRGLAMGIYFIVLLLVMRAENRLAADTVLVVCATLMLSVVEIIQIDLLVTQRYLAAGVIGLGKGSVLFVAALACMLLHGDYRWFVQAYAMMAVALVVGGWITLRPRFGRVSRQQMRLLITASLPFAISIAAFGFTNNWGANYVRGFLGEQQAGLYFVPLKVYQVVLIVGAAVSSVVLPLFHSLAHRAEYAVYRQVFRRLMSGMLAMAGVVLGICVLVPLMLVRILATADYADASGLFPILAVALCLRVLSIPTENVLESVGRQHWRVGIQVVGAALCCLLVIFLVPRRGLMGAALAALIVDLWLCAAFWIVARRFLPMVVSPRAQLQHVVVLIALLTGARVAIRIGPLPALALFLIAWGAYCLRVMNLRSEWRRLRESQGT